jgi:hypothetical protein
MKILVLTWYGWKDALLAAKKSLEKIGYEVVEFPLFKFAHDIYEKRKDYLDYFSNFITSENPDIILWWCIQITYQEHEIIFNRHRSILHIFFSWDDPFIWECTEVTNIDKKAKYFDIVFITCEHSIPFYINNGTKQAYCLHCGYDPVVNYPIENSNYKYDVSIGLTNLYENETVYKNQYINRKYFIDELVKQTDLRIAIYGPEFLKKIYPNNYISYVQYSQLNQIINDSKINISTHVTNKNKYINERCILIIGSGGLLYVDPIVGNESIFIEGENCIHIDKENFIEQIRYIIDNYEEYDPIRKNGHKLSENYTWDKWAAFIHDKIKDHEKLDLSKKKVNQEIQSIETKIKFLDWSEYIEGNKILNDLDKEVTSSSLQSLMQFSNQNPYFNVNELLVNYFDMKLKN